MTTMRTKVATLVVGVGMLGGGLVATDALATPTTASPALMPALQASPNADEVLDPPCLTDQSDDENEADEADDADDENEADEADDADDENEADDADDADDEYEADEADDADMQPGRLDDGDDLLPQATISLEQAIAAATGAAQGDVGEVDLELRSGVLVFAVAVGDQVVSVDALSGDVISVAAEEDEEDDACDDATPVAAGTLDDGQSLRSQATITLEQAIAAAQGAATGDVGEVDLELRDGTLVYTVDIGDRDIHVDAATGAVIGDSADD